MKRAPKLRVIEGKLARLRGPRYSVLPLYHPGEGQRCPACQGRAWHVGRAVAECADPACGLALPIAGSIAGPIADSGQQ